MAFPSKINYASGDILTAAQMNDIGSEINALNGAVGKNKIINGDFNINQRNFTSLTTNFAFGFDRWFIIAVGGTTTYTPQTFTLGAAPVAGYEGKTFARVVTTGQSAAADISCLRQHIESVRTLAGQTITVSFWAKAGSGTPKIALELAQIFGTGGSTTVDNYFGQVTLSTSWQRFSLTGTLPSISGKTIGTLNDDFVRFNFFISAGSNFNARSGSLGIQSNTFDFWGVQVEAGSLATAFQTATGTLQGELAACERYFQIVTGQVATGFSTTVIGTSINFRTQMRAAPTVALSAAMAIRDSGADYTQSAANVSIVSSRANERGIQIEMGNFTGITANRPYVTNITGSQIQFSSEL